MEQQIQEKWNNKYVLIGHVVLCTCVLLYCLTYVFAGEDVSIVKYLVGAGFSIISMCFEIINYKGKSAILSKKKFGIVFRIVCLIVWGAFYYMADIKLEGNIFFVCMVICMAELLFRVAISSKAARIAVYVLFAFAYAMLSIIMIVVLIQREASRVTLSIGIREIAFVVVTLLLILFIGETISLIWNHMEKQILKQNRAMEDLNEVYEALKDQQEKVNLVNEKLGVQKIELQAANMRINRAHDEMSVQNEIATAIVSSVNNKDMLNQIVDIMQVRLDMDVVAVILEEDNSMLVPGEVPQGRSVYVASSLGKAFEKNLLDSVYKTDLKALLSMHQTYIQNTETESVKFFEFLQEDQELTSVICLPILNKKERLGTLVIGKNRRNVFMDGRAFYENISSQISIGISNLKLYEQMNDMAIRDGLTRIYNRRHLTEVINEYLAEAMAKKIPVSLTLFDIDKFKMINDTYGHQCGDEVIRYVATLLNRVAIKYGGVAGRYGGEEFVVAFRGKDIDTTYEIIKEVHQQIRDEEVVYDDTHVQVRVSAGIASYPETCTNPSDLLTRADWAMYHSKQNGRDQITIDSDQIASKM